MKQVKLPARCLAPPEFIPGVGTLVLLDSGAFVVTPEGVKLFYSQGHDPISNWPHDEFEKRIDCSRYSCVGPGVSTDCVLFGNWRRLPNRKPYIVELQCFDFTGTPLWSKTIDEGSVSEIIARGSYFYIVVFDCKTENGSYADRVIKMDQAGNILWRSDIVQFERFCEVLSNGSVLLIGATEQDPVTLDYENYHLIQILPDGSQKRIKAYQDLGVVQVCKLTGTKLDLFYCSRPHEERVPQLIRMIDTFDITEPENVRCVSSRACDVLGSKFVVWKWGRDLTEKGFLAEDVLERTVIWEPDEIAGQECGAVYRMPYDFELVCMKPSTFRLSNGVICCGWWKQTRQGRRGWLSLHDGDFSCMMDRKHDIVYMRATQDRLFTIEKRGSTYWLCEASVQELADFLKCERERGKGAISGASAAR